MTDLQISDAWAMRPAMLRLAHRLLRWRPIEDAEDMYSAVMVSALPMEIEHLKSYMRVAITNECFAHMRRRTNWMESRVPLTLLRKDDEEKLVDPKSLGDITRFEAEYTLEQLNRKAAGRALMIVTINRDQTRREVMELHHAREALSHSADKSATRFALQKIVCYAKSK